jgi:MoaA/NifB/PqqE/SkfB family radical SAM enzyme
MEVLENYLSPIYATWYMTRRCNLACKYCYVDVQSTAFDAGESNTESAKRLIHNLASSDICQLAFAGGEPFIRKDLLELASFARNQGLTIQVSTNASLPNMPTAKNILDAGFQCIQVSFDGSTQDMHDAIRGTGSFKRVLQFISDCKKAKLPVIAAYSLTETSILGLRKFRELCEKNGIEIIKLQPIVKSFQIIEKNNFLTPPTERLIFPIIDDVFQNSDIKLHVTEQTNIRLMKYVPMHCNMDLRSAIVWEDGSVGTCDFDRSNAFGNVFEESFSSVWEIVKKYRRNTPACGCFK